jgi:hypothetical protein
MHAQPAGPVLRFTPCYRRNFKKHPFHRDKLKCEVKASFSKKSIKKQAFFSQPEKAKKRLKKANF